MKKILLTIAILLAISCSMINSQTPMSLSASGGYSWLTGVLGAEAQIGNIGLSAGWMPTKMPISKEKINSYSFAVSYYTLKTGQEGYSGYLTLAESTQGYRYEDSWGGESTMPILIFGGGVKYDTDGVWSKLGIGYGWCDLGNAWTFEFTLGFVLFGN